MSLSLQPSLRQTTSISPQIQQSLQLLQTPAMELQTLLQTELQTNPVLEEELPPVETRETTDSEQEDEDPLGQNLDWPVSSSRPDRPRLDPRQALLESKVLPESLTDHLVSQLALSAAAPAVRQAATEIIGNLDEDGFLRAELSDITSATGVSPEVVQQALTLVQSFHPPGIAARSLPEALVLQLQSRGREDSLETRIVQHHFDLLGKRKFSEISSALAVPVDSVHAAAEAIARLSPRPGAAFAPDRPDLVVRPEASFIRDGERWVPNWKTISCPAYGSATCTRT